MEPKLSRREFLKLGLIGLGAAAMLPTSKVFAAAKAPRLVLVGNQNGVSVHKLPDENSLIIYQIGYNEIVNVYDAVESPAGPYWNPIWFRVWGGYIFSGDVY